MKDVIKQIVIALITSFCAFFLGIWGDWQKEETQQIEYLVKEQSSLLHLPDPIKNSIDITFNGKKQGIYQ